MLEADGKTVRLGIVVGAIALCWIAWCLVSCDDSIVKQNYQFEHGYSTGLEKAREK